MIDKNPDLIKLSVTVLTKNAEETLQRTLDSLKEFAEVLLFDTGSSDRTLEIAGQYPNVRIVSDSFQGFGKTHNLASGLATYDWIFSVDSDEVATPELVHAIRSLSLDKETVYSVNRKNYFRGKYIHCWHPDRIVRIYNRHTTRFSDAEVHEKILPAKKMVRLSGSLLHTPYRSMEQLLSKMQFYSSLFAKQNKGKSSSLGKALLHSWAAFFKSYILKKGFLSGREGLIISLYNAHTAYYKYLKLSNDP